MTIQEQYVASDGYKELRVYLQLFLEQHGLTLMFDGEDTRGMAEAKKVLDGAFAALDEKFRAEEKVEPIKRSSR